MELLQQSESRRRFSLIAENVLLRNSNEGTFIHPGTQAWKSLHLEYKHKDPFYFNLSCKLTESYRFPNSKLQGLNPTGKHGLGIVLWPKYDDYKMEMKEAIPQEISTPSQD